MHIPPEWEFRVIAEAWNRWNQETSGFQSANGGRSAAAEAVKEGVRANSGGLLAVTALEGQDL
jgi:hypothetical protein